MRPAFLYAHLKRFRTVFAATFCAMLLMLIAGNAIGQAANLSLADLLIALRSKKATLEERNSILSEAVSKRGVTFTLTPQIEKELESAGAGKELLDSIRNKAAIVKIASVVPSLPEPAAKPEVKPPDAAFYEKRGAENASNDKIDPAIDDYSKAIEMNPTAMSAYVGRAEAYSRKELWALSLSDLSKVLEAAPEDARALAVRANVYEKQGKLEAAEADYKKISGIEPANDSAKANAARIRKAIDDAYAKANPKPPRPESLNVGSLSETNAVRMVKPIYPQTAYRQNVGGKVSVEVTLDEEGNVTSAKAVSGHQLLRNASEDAAKRSKFNVVLFEDRPIKAQGVITYNFVPQR